MFFMTLCPGTANENKHKNVIQPNKRAVDVLVKKQKFVWRNRVYLFDGGKKIGSYQTYSYSYSYVDATTDLN